MIFPAYTELERRSTERMGWANLWSILIYTSCFLITGITGTLLFGSDIESDFLASIATRAGTVSMFIRASFCVVLIFHIPYFFFGCKEFVLVIYDEIVDRSLSTHLSMKLAEH